MNKLTTKAGLVALALTVQVATGSIMAANAQQVIIDTQGHWAQSDIQALVDRQVLTPYPDGQFHPEAWMTRSEFITTVSRALGIPESQLRQQYPMVRHVAENQGGFTTITTVQREQLDIDRLPEAQFRPNNPIRRVEALALIGDLVPGQAPSQANARAILDEFDDDELVPGWAERPVAKAIQANIFANDPDELDELDPLVPITRAEVAALVNDMLAVQGIAGQPGTPAMRTQAGQPTITTQEMVVERETDVDTYVGGHTVIEESETVYRASQVRTPGTPSAGSRLLIPGQTVMTTMATPLFSAYNDVGDRVVAILNSPLLSTDGQVVIPAGSRIIGQVTHVESARQHGGFDFNWRWPRLAFCPPASQEVVEYEEGDVDVQAVRLRGPSANMEIRFHEIFTPFNQRFRIEGTVASEDGRLYPGHTDALVVSGDRSVQALLGDMKTEIGGLVGTDQGKQFFYDRAIIVMDSDLLHNQTEDEVLIGSGDKLQIRLAQLGGEGLPVVAPNTEPVSPQRAPVLQDAPRSSGEIFDLGDSIEK